MHGDDHQNLRQAIERVYEAFARYTDLSETFGDCTWLSPQQIVVLKTKPLRELSAADLEGYSWQLSWCGTLEDLKHFLPRLLELFAFDGLGLLPPDFFLPQFMVSSEPDVEKISVETVLLLIWDSLINTYPFHFFADEFLAGLALLYADIKPFLIRWEAVDSVEGLRQLSSFSSEATYSGTWEFAQVQNQKQQVIDWLVSDKTILKLEDAALEYSAEPFSQDFFEAAETLQKWKSEYTL